MFAEAGLAAALAAEQPIERRLLCCDRRPMIAARPVRSGRQQPLFPLRSRQAQPVATAQANERGDHRDRFRVGFVDLLDAPPAGECLVESMQPGQEAGQTAVAVQVIRCNICCSLQVAQLGGRLPKRMAGRGQRRECW